MDFRCDFRGPRLGRGHRRMRPLSMCSLLFAVARRMIKRNQASSDSAVATELPLPDAIRPFKEHKTSVRLVALVTCQADRNWSGDR